MRPTFGAGGADSATRGWSRCRALRRRLVASALLLTGLFCFVFAIRIVEPLGPDQGLFACFSLWLPRGWLPYRDLFDSKPPLFLYWFALAHWIPDALPRALWWLEGAWLILTVLALARLVSRRFGAVAATAASALLMVGMWCPGFGGFAARVQAEEILALPMLGSAAYALGSAEKPRRALLAGVLAGACSLMKVPSLALAAAWSVYWIAHAGPRRAVRSVACLSLGATLPWALASAWFGAQHEAASFYHAVFSHQFAYAKLLARPIPQVLVEFASQLLLTSLPLLLPAAVGIITLFRRRSPDAVWLSAWLGFSVAAVLAQRQLAEYHYLLLVPPLATAGGYGISSLVRATRAVHTRRVAWVTLSLWAASLCWVGTSWFSAYAPGLALLRGSISRSMYLRQSLTLGYSTVTEEEAARFIKARTLPEQGILVWAWHPGVYSLSGRHPTTRYAFHKVMLTDAPLSLAQPSLEQRRAEFLQRIQLDTPAYIVVENGDRNFFDPRDSDRSLAAFSQLSALLSAKYRLDRQVGRLALYRRKG